MPISNPILQGLTVYQGVDLILSDSDPITAPIESKKFWFNYADRNLFLAIATNSVTDWIALGGSPNWADIEGKPDTFPTTWDEISGKPDIAPSIDAETILNKILVQDGVVLTTDDNIIFED